MTKTHNQRIWRDDQAELKRIADDFEFIGRKFKLEDGLLTIFALPQRKVKPKRDDEREPRNKRAESAGRRS